MGIRNLTEWNDPIFRKTSRIVEKFDERLWNLLDDMRDTLEKVNGEIDHLDGILFTNKVRKKNI